VCNQEDGWFSKRKEVDPRVNLSTDAAVVLWEGSVVVDASFSGMKRKFNPGVSLQLLEMSPSEIATRNTFT